MLAILMSPVLSCSVMQIIFSPTLMSSSFDTSISTNSKSRILAALRALIWSCEPLVKTEIRRTSEYCEAMQERSELSNPPEKAIPNFPIPSRRSLMERCKSLITSSGALGAFGDEVSFGKVRGALSWMYLNVPSPQKVSTQHSRMPDRT